MIATTTTTHRVTMPKKMSSYLSRKAKSEKISMSQAIQNIVEEYHEMVEDLRLSAILAEREAQGEKLIPMSEVWKP